MKIFLIDFTNPAILLIRSNQTLLDRCTVAQCQIENVTEVYSRWINTLQVGTFLFQTITKFAVSLWHVYKLLEINITISNYLGSLNPQEQ